jgi:hypothetical protein
VKFKDIPKSPVFPLGYRFDFKKQGGGYESDITALVRRMLENKDILEDQRFAWERWSIRDSLNPKK